MFQKKAHNIIGIALVTMLLIGSGTQLAQAKTVRQSHSPITGLSLQGPDRTPTWASPSEALSIDINQPTSPQELAQAMGIKTSDIVSASFNGSDTRGVGIGMTPLGNYFPTEGSTFAILSSGLAESADDPNNEGSLSFELDGLNNSQGNDLTQLVLKLKVPANMNCASFDFAYYSEEFPEFVGSIFNDAFTAELGGTNLSIVDDQVVAPLNFAFDTEGNIISVNTVFGVTENTGTTYDGGTSLLRAQTLVTPGSTVDIVFSIQDLGDSVWDSSVFLDKFFWSTDSQCGGSAQEDADGDGLLDIWETQGLTVSVDGDNVFVDLPAMGANPNKKDVFVEVDYMVDDGVCIPNIGCIFGHSHQPKAEAISKIIIAFANAPVPNPDGSTGVNLHVDYGPDSGWGDLSQSNSIPHVNNLGSRLPNDNYNWDEFDDLKESNFSKARAAVFHYCIFAHNLGGMGGITGISRDRPASDFIVSLGSIWGGVGSENEQAGTFMHELGHNLGLRHGGDDHNNYEPNYLSVMNYSFQTRGLRINGQDGNFDYSRFEVPSLNENDLDETIGLNGGLEIDEYGTRYFCSMDNDEIVDRVNDPIDWNCDNDEDDTSVKENINEGTYFTHDVGFTILKSYNDWENLVFTGGAIGQPGANPELPLETKAEEITNEEDMTFVTPYKVSVSASNNSIVLLGEVVEHIFTLSNLGNNNDIYSITVNSSQGWSDISSVPTSIPLSAGTSTDILITTNVPVSANAFATEKLTLTATSQTNALLQDTAMVQTSVIGPKVLSIMRNDLNPTIANTVSFEVTFLVSVINVDKYDFSLATSGVTGASITTVSPDSGSADTYTVTVNTGSGNGTIRLDLKASGTGIEDLAGNPISGGYSDGQVYEILDPLSSSEANFDGFVLESDEHSNQGGIKRTDTDYLNVGDNRKNRQICSFLSISTQEIPSGSTITGASLLLKRMETRGDDPLLSHGDLLVFIRQGAFSDNLALQIKDFQAAPSFPFGLALPNSPVDEWFTLELSQEFLRFIQPRGHVQFKLCFDLDDDNDGIADQVRFYSGDAVPEFQPQLLVTWETISPNPGDKHQGPGIYIIK